MIKSMPASRSIAIAALAAYAACSKPADPPTGKRGGGREGGKLEFPVDVATLEARQMQYTVTAPGSLEAFQQVQITARVAGAVDKVAFVEGQTVKANDALVTIESERYQIGVEQAQSTLLKAQATQKAAEAALGRRLTAQQASPGLVPGEEIEQKQTAVDTAKADVEAAKQGLRIAQLNLRDAFVRAPIAGVVQTRTVQQGQFLQAGAVLATILQRDPLLLRFQVTEQDSLRLKPDMPATLRLKESAREYTAKIVLVGGAADPATRMVPITAQVDQTDHQHFLLPGAFCEVTVPVGNARKGIVAPSLAVQPTEKGNVVYIVDDKHIAHAKVVELGMHTSDGGVELTRGVTAGELMVVRGIDPLTDGAPVKIGSTITLDQAQGSGSGSGSGSAAAPTTGSTINPVTGPGGAAGSAADPTVPTVPTAHEGHKGHKDAP